MRPATKAADCRGTIASPRPRAPAPCRGRRTKQCGSLALRTGLVVALAFVASTGRAEAPAAGDAVSRARTLRLADDPEWFHLLHYETDLFGGTSSEVSRGDFFLSPRGGV